MKVSPLILDTDDKKQYRELQKIQQSLKGISQRNWAKKGFHATSDADTIKECKDKIKHCIDMFNVSYLG